MSAALTIYANKDATSPREAVFSDDRLQTRSAGLQFVIEDGKKIQAVILDQDGTVNLMSTSGAYSRRLALGLLGSTPVAMDDAPTIGGGDDGYTFILNTSNADAEALLGSQEEVKCWLELELTDGDGNVVTVFQQEVLLLNQVAASSSTGPVPGPTYDLRFIRFRYERTGLTGGTSNTLDGIVTAGGAVLTNTVYAMVISGAMCQYQLVAGTDAEAAPGIIRPDDYNASTNARVWKQVL